MLQTCREQGLHRIDPVRFAFIEALARRSAGHAGEARRLLDERLARLVDAYARQAQEAGQAHEGGQNPDAARKGGTGGGLRGLLDRLEAGRTALSEAGGDADVLDYFRTLWAGLRVGSELRQAMENVPENAGPLNSIHLVHQSLQLMHELAPDYLRHFLSYADTLSCLERMSGADLLLAKGVPSRGESPKKAGKSRSG